MNRSLKHIMRMGLVALATLMLWLPGPIPAAAGQGHRALGEEGAVQVRLPKVSVTIASKSARSVTTNIGDRFTVSKQTIIFGMDGHQVSIRDLLVPCEAEVTYSKGDGKQRLAEKIRIKSIGRNPTWLYQGKEGE